MPPFGGDAFRPVGMFDTEYLLAPAEHDGWVVRHRCNGLNRFGPGEEPKRTGPCKRPIQGSASTPGGGRCRTGSCSGGRRDDRTLGDMAFLQGHLNDVFAAEPVAEPVGQFGDAGIVLLAALVECYLPGGEFLAGGCGQGDRIDAESRLDTVQLGGEQPGKMCGIAAGPAGAGLKPVYRAVRMIEGEGQAARADPVGL